VVSKQRAHDDDAAAADDDKPLETFDV